MQPQPGMPQANPTQACRNFAQSGSCKFGDKCRFVHMSPEQVAMNPGMAPAPPPRGNKPCRDFAKGTCTRGASCKFSHDQQAGGMPGMARGFPGGMPQAGPVVPQPGAGFPTMPPAAPGGFPTGPGAQPQFGNTQPGGFPASQTGPSGTGGTSRPPKLCRQFQAGTCAKPNCSMVHQFDRENSLGLGIRFNLQGPIDQVIIVSEVEIAFTTANGMLMKQNFYDQNVTWSYSLQCQVTTLFNADTYFMMGSNAHGNKLLVIESQQSQASVYDCPDIPTAFAMYDAGRFVTGGATGSLCMWNSQFAGLGYCGAGQVQTAITALQPNGQYIIGTTSDGFILVWQVNEQNPQQIQISQVWCSQNFGSSINEFIRGDAAFFGACLSGEVITLNPQDYTVNLAFNTNKQNQASNQITCMTQQKMNTQQGPKTYLVMGTGNGIVIRYQLNGQNWQNRGAMFLFPKGDAVKGVFSTQYGIMAVSTSQLVFLTHNAA